MKLTPEQIAARVSLVLFDEAAHQKAHDLTHYFNCRACRAVVTRALMRHSAHCAHKAADHFETPMIFAEMLSDALVSFDVAMALDEATAKPIAQALNLDELLSAIKADLGMKPRDTECKGGN